MQGTSYENKSDGGDIKHVTAPLDGLTHRRFREIAVKEKTTSTNLLRRLVYQFVDEQSEKSPSTMRKPKYGHKGR